MNSDWASEQAQKKLIRFQIKDEKKKEFQVEN